MNKGKRGACISKVHMNAPSFDRRIAYRNFTKKMILHTIGVCTLSYHSDYSKYIDSVRYKLGRDFMLNKGNRISALLKFWFELYLLTVLNSLCASSRVPCDGLILS
jgi:hypothetical protein